MRKIFSYAGTLIGIIHISQFTIDSDRFDFMPATVFTKLSYEFPSDTSAFSYQLILPQITAAYSRLAAYNCIHFSISRFIECYSHGSSRGITVENSYTTVVNGPHLGQTENTYRICIPLSAYGDIYVITTELKTIRDIHVIRTFD